MKILEKAIMKNGVEIQLLDNTTEDFKIWYMKL